VPGAVAPSADGCTPMPDGTTFCDPSAVMVR